MEKQINATHLADAQKSNVEKQTSELIKTGNLEFKDVTFNRDYPVDVGEYRALIGFRDQQEAEIFAKLTGGEFTLFYKEDGWHLLSYIGGARLTNIYQLAGRYPVVLLNGDENYYQVCEKVFGLSLIDWLKDALDIEVPESWIENAIECSVKKTSQYPEGISKEDEDLYDEIEDKVRESLRYIENFKGCKGYTVVDDVNWSVVGEYDDEYPAHYHEDTENYIFGVMYKADREEEIRKIIEG